MYTCYARGVQSQTCLHVYVQSRTWLHVYVQSRMRLHVTIRTERWREGGIVTRTRAETNRQYDKQIECLNQVGLLASSRRNRSTGLIRSLTVHEAQANSHLGPH